MPRRREHRSHNRFRSHQRSKQLNRAFPAIAPLQKPPPKSEKQVQRRQRNEAKRQLLDGHRERILRLHKQIVGTGLSRRFFAGKIIIDNEQVAVRKAIAHEQAHPGFANLVLWTDGAQHHKGDEQGVMGAGVVWRPDPGRPTHWDAKECMLGRDTGDSNDAKVFAIADALGVALEMLKTWYLASVTVYSDSGCVLQALEQGTCCALGPLLSPRWALEDLFDRANHLVRAGVRVELRWVKGHIKGGSEGHWNAHEAANRAVAAQARLLGVRRSDKVVMPECLRELGKDIDEEFMFRTSRPCLAYDLSEHPTLGRDGDTVDTRGLMRERASSMDSSSSVEFIGLDHVSRD